MADFTISLAGIPIGISLFHPDIQWFFSDYLSNETPLFSVGVTEKDIAYERICAERDNAGEDGEKLIFPDRNLEVISILRSIASRLPEYDTVLFHGSAIAVDGRAYIFAAPSGTGKTTHTRLWLEQIPGSHILNGDKPFLKVQPDGSVLACGVPWRGKEDLGCSEILPLEAICLLERSQTNRIMPLEPKDAISGLLRQTNMPEEPLGKIRTLQLLDQICRSVRLFHLGCNMEPEAARVSMAAMIPR